MTNSVIFSGVKPSGAMTLGNYLGAFKRFSAYEEKAKVILSVVDLHAITVRQDPAQLREWSYSIAAWYLASGINPDQTTLFIQSHVSAHTEMAWLLSTYTQLGELNRQTQYKDKAQKGEQNLSVGFYTYPVLMAADILLHHTTQVPVGDDQKQHVELCRDVAMRFNNLYGKVFTLPEPVMATEAGRVMDLQDPTKKMSKSEESGGTILLLDDASTIEKKIKRAVTDTLGKVAYDKANQPGVANLIEIYAACKNVSIKDATAELSGSQYGALKAAVAEAVLTEVIPLQERFNALMGDRELLDDIFEAGAMRARRTADETLRKAYEAVGFVPAKGR